MNTAFQSHLTFPLADFAAAVGLSLGAVRQAGERGELVIEEDGQVDLWEEQNWRYFMRAVNKRNSGGNNNMENQKDNPAEILRYGKDQWGKNKRYGKTKKWGNGAQFGKASPQMSSDTQMNDDTQSEDRHAERN